MKLIDMKMPKKSASELEAECKSCSIGDQDCWPYGLQLRFEKDQVDKIPELKGFKVGDRVIVTGEASVTGIRMSERQNGKEDHSVELQIEKVAVAPASNKKPEEMNLKEYEAFRKQEK